MSVTTATVFNFQCPYCHKNREITAKNGYIGSVEIERIKCICGKDVSVYILKYLMRKKNFILKDRDYIVQ